MDVEKCFVPERNLNRCYKEWNDVDSSIISEMQERGKEKVCKLQNLIKKESFARELWAEYFFGQDYLDFTQLSLDDCIFFFLKLEDNMALRSPGVHKVVGGHYDL